MEENKWEPTTRSCPINKGIGSKSWSKGYSINNDNLKNGSSQINCLILHMNLSVTLNCTWTLRITPQIRIIKNNSNLGDLMRYNPFGKAEPNMMRLIRERQCQTGYIKTRLRTKLPKTRHLMQHTYHLSSQGHYGRSPWTIKNVVNEWLKISNKRNVGNDTRHPVITQRMEANLGYSRWLDWLHLSYVAYVPSA